MNGNSRPFYQRIYFKSSSFLTEPPHCRILFPCSQEIQREEGEPAYDLKALLSQLLQKLRARQLSSSVLQRGTIFPSREQSLLDGAGWNTIPGFPVYIEKSKKSKKARRACVVSSGLGNQLKIPLRSDTATRSPENQHAGLG